MRGPLKKSLARAMISLGGLVVLLVALPAAAERPAAGSPHDVRTADTGRITGKLIRDGRAPMAGQIVKLEILKGQALILSIPKPTDSQGRYEFKNIFKSNDFAYAISAEYDGRIYRTPFVSLAAGENERTLNLAVGAGSQEAAPLPAAPAEETVDGMESDHERQTVGLGQYKLLAAILSLGAVGFAVAGRRRVQR